MKVVLLLLLVLNFAQAQKIISPKDYDYPMISNLEATFGVASLAPVAGSVWWDIKISPKKRYINGKLSLIDIRFYKPQKRCKEQTKSLVFILTGVTGSASDGIANQYAHQLTQECHHALILPSIFNQNFVNSSSSTGVVGNSLYDMKDFYDFMKKSVSYIEENHDLIFNNYSLLGYSLGALTSAYIHKLDEDQKSFNFEKTLLINPPVDLDYSLSKVDNFKSNLKKIGKVKRIRLLAKIGKHVAIHKRVKTNRVVYLNFINSTKMADFQYKAMIGFDLSKELTDIILCSKDVLKSVHGRDLGIIPNYRRRIQKKLAKMFGYKDYFLKFVMGYREDFDNLPPMDYKDFISQNSITSLTHWLKTHNDIYIMHNKDDFIISQSDIEYLKETFGDRLTLYPRGGHMGNIWHDENVKQVNSIIGSNNLMAK